MCNIKNTTVGTEVSAAVIHPPQQIIMMDTNEHIHRWVKESSDY